VEASKDSHALYVSKVERDQVREAIQQLPDEFREIIVLREYEELSYQEIATLLDCQAGTVMSRLGRAPIETPIAALEYFAHSRSKSEGSNRMSDCEERSTDILLYLNNALTGQRLEDFRAHLAGCSNCRERFQEELALSSLLRETRPLYLAPQALRARVAAAALQQSSAGSPLSGRSGETRMQKLRRWWRDATRRVFGWKPMVAMALVLVLSLVFIPGAVQRVHANDFVEAATEIHRSYLDGALPLQCRSRSPEVVTDWFAGKTPFHFQLPISQSVPEGKTLYWLTGARLVSYKDSAAALVAYETPTEKISLLVASSKSVAVAGGEEVRSRGLTFHYRSGANFEVITWTNHGLAYALVASLTGSPQHSCLVCHQNMADQNLVEH